MPRLPWLILPLLVVSWAFASESVPLVNPSFEQPGTGDEIDNFSEVPGWGFAGGDTTALNSFDPASDGTWSCTLGPNESFVFQPTAHSIQAGDYELRVDARGTGDLQLALYAGETTLATQTLQVSGDYATKTLTATVPTGSPTIGQALGVRFRNTRANTFPSVDNVRVSLTAAATDPTDPTDPTVAPTPDPLTWAAVPSPGDAGQILMTANAATSANGVEYSFEETTGNPGGSDSGWQDSAGYADTELVAGSEYCYRVKARDKGGDRKETAYAAVQCAVAAAIPEPPTIVYPSDGSARERLAAKEVRRYLYLRTDLLLSVEGVTALPGTGNLILVAQDNHPMVEGLRAALNHTTTPGGFLLKSTKVGGRTVLVITGHDSAATLRAAYRYAEHLGVGFDLAGDAIPDAKTTLSLTGLDEVGEPLFPIRGIQPFHDLPEGPDFWNTADYQTVISQLPKMGMNFIGLHTYPQFSTTEEKDQNRPQGPEPTVWIGRPEDVNADGTVAWSYPTSYAHTQRPDRRWGFATWDTDEFSAGSSQLFPTNGFGSDVIGPAMPTTLSENNAVFDRTGEMLNEAFTHARNLGVKTAVGTELPLGKEAAGPEVGYDWARGMPSQLQARLVGLGKDPMDPEVVKDIYKGIFQRIQRTHPLDYFWLWSYEIWSYYGFNAAQVQAMKKDILLADEALAELGRPFQLGLAGWILGTADNPAEFDSILPSDAPFFSLWDAADGFEALSPDRVQWPATWLEEDWGLNQPQLEVRRIHTDAKAAWERNTDGLIAKHWRTRVLGATTHALADILWSYGSTGTPVTRSIPANRDDWVDAVYLDWATRQFGASAAAEIATLFATLDKAGESGPGALPRIMHWETELQDADGAPGAIAPNPADWTTEKAKYDFVADLEALRPRVVGAGNRDRFDYWLKTFQTFRLMGEYGCVRHDFETAAANEDWSTALTLRKRMARLWEQLMTREVERARNASEWGEIVNLEVLNWKQLMVNKWDATLEAGLGSSLPPDAYPRSAYTGSAFVRVAPVQSLVGTGKPLDLTVILMENPTSATLRYRPMGTGDYTEIPLTHVARGVYEATIPPQPGDFEYYIEAQTPTAEVRFPVSAPTTNQTVVVSSAEAPEPPTLSDLEQWRVQQFGTSRNAGDAANSADPDGDAFDNLMEYGLGGIPLSPDAARIRPRLATVAGGELRFLYRRQVETADLSYRVQVSTDLVHWHYNGDGTGSSYTEELPNPVPEGDGTETVTVRPLPVPSAGQPLFLRLEILYQP